MEIDRNELARMIDLSCVRADSTEAEMLEAVDLALRRHCACVFALPAHTPFVAAALRGSRDTLLGGVVGFPDGGATTRGKAREAEELLGMGCDELDMVINIAWLKAGKLGLFQEDIAAVVAAAAGRPVKTILECHHLSDAEIVRACEVAADAGAAFVKTGTGWAPSGATPERVRLMKEAVGNRCQVKAAGGIRDLDTLLALLHAGATRFGLGVRTAKTILEQ